MMVRYWAPEGEQLLVVCSKIRTTIVFLPTQ
ncbi:hypothetical protein LINPERHAP2_LOCUS41988 [Linum perenne]